jgi:ribonuclease T1
VLGVVVLAVLTWALNQGGFSGGGRDGDTDTVTLPVVALASLPAEAQDTVALIDAGGPFPYDRDGIVFENREHLLPSEPTGYYHEYTVPTPGSSDRGARRIITGSAREMYWTDDHYQSFERIAR